MCGLLKAVLISQVSLLAGSCRRLYPLCHAPTLSGAPVQEASLSTLPQRLLSPWLSPDYSVLEGSICAQSGVHRTTGMLAHAEVNDPKGGAEPNRTRISSYLFFHCGRE